MRTHLFCAIAGMTIGCLGTIGFTLAETQLQKTAALVLPLALSTGLSYYAIVQDDTRI
jgi:hypothetical protein